MKLRHLKHPIKTIGLMFIGIVLTDRAAQAGGASSGVSLYGGLTLADAHKWISFYAAIIGALGATATLFYICLKIWLLLKAQPEKD